MALISVENVTVGLLCSRVHSCIFSYSKICMIVMSLLQKSAHLGQLFKMMIFDQAQMVTVVPECIQTVEPRVSVSRDVKGKCFRLHVVIFVQKWSLDGNVCAFCAAVSSTESWPASQSDSLPSHATNRDAYPDLSPELSVFLLYQLLSTFRVGVSGMQILILNMLVSCYPSPLWPSNLSIFPLIIQIWVSVPAGQEESRYP